MNTRLPKHIIEQYGTVRKWKALKRKQCAAVVLAISQLRVGCSFFPSGPDIVSELGILSSMLQDELSVKKWGR